MKYCFDTSAFIEPWRRLYPPDVFPAVWEKLDDLIGTGRLIATIEVYEDLKRKDDEILEWAKIRKDIFLPIDDGIQETLIEILGTYPRLVDSKRGRSGSDPWVVALARMEECAVVTYETPSGNLDKPKIPDVCQDMRIDSMNLLDLFREEGWRLV